MRLLFDENLSPRLSMRLVADYPGSAHIDQCGLHGRPDIEVWAFAAAQGFTVVSKDNDFRQLSFLKGHPPKVIWLSAGNAGTGAIADILVRGQPLVARFIADPEASLLILR